MGSCGSKSVTPQDNRATSPKAEETPKRVEIQNVKGAEYSLTYFPVFARGFAPALCLEEHDFAWTGETKTFDTWPAMKETGICPFGQLPILETPDAGVIGQSTAIVKHLGRVKNALGSTMQEQNANEMLIALADDFFGDLGKTQPTAFQPEKGTAEAIKEMWETTFVTRLGYLEKFANGKDRFTEAGNSVGELTLFATMHQMVLVKGDCLDTHTNVKAFYKRVLALPSTQKVITGKSPIGEFGQYFISGN